MRLVTFRVAGGPDRAGVITTGSGTAAVVDLQTATDGDLPATLVDLLAAGEPAMDVARAIAENADPAAALALDSVELRAPIPRPSKLLATAANYQAHIIEGGLAPVDKSRIVPKLFLKPSTAILDPGAALRLPTLSSSVDWELELAVVIGRPTRRIVTSQALDHVAGYTVINDISARTLDWPIPNREATSSDAFFDWLMGKWLDGFAPLGPWLVTADDLPDPNALDLTLLVNGEVRQDGSTADMLFGVAELVAFASQLMTLEPGDVIATGTPAGVGATTKTYLEPGDVMEGSIQGIGTLRTPVIGSDAG